MLVKITKLLCLLLLCFPLHSQHISDALKKRCEASLEQFKDFKNYKELYTAFLEENWDSTLMLSVTFSARQIPPELQDYISFYRGISFQNKKVTNQASRELLKISKDFDLYDLTRTILGEIELENNRFDQALIYFKEVETDNFLESSIVRKSNLLHNLGLCYMHLGKFDLAEPYLLKSLNLHETEQDTLQLIGSYNSLANFYYEQYKDRLAIPYFDKAYRLAAKSESLLMKETTAFNMAIVEENRKDYPQALAYRKEYEVWRDSLNDQNNIYEIAQKERAFEVARKQNEIDLLAAENEVNIARRNGFLYTSAALLLLLVIGGYLYRDKVRNNRIIAQQKEALDELNETKDKLFSVVSHDLRTSVNTLKQNHSRLQISYQQKESDQVEFLLKTNELLASSTYHLLDNLFQWALVQTQQAYFSIEPMKLFFIIEQVAYNFEALFQVKNISFHNRIDKSTSVLADQESVKIILRNLLDNAVKYSDPGSEISIYLQNNDVLYCDLVVEDTGVGIADHVLQLLQGDPKLSPAQLKEHVKGSGLGLGLCKSLIEKNDGLLNIQSREGIGTKMIITLPKPQTV